MTSLKPLPWRPVAAGAPWTHPLRRAAAMMLRGASAVLARMARRVAIPVRRADKHPPGTLEFYADAGAPEGALYRDGELVGWLPGVRRL